MTLIALTGTWHNIYVMTDRLTRTVQFAIRQAPCSVKALADAAGVPQSTLARIMSGERNATVAVAESLAGALRGWGRDCTKAAEQISRAIGENQ